MKRFFAIFGICFAAFIVFFGAYLGICFLKGDFKEEKILPNDIRFEQENYYVSDNFEMVILTDTENVNQDTINLSFNSLPKPTSDKSKITDGVLIIPKTVKIGVPFTVELKRDIDEELGKNWINGGISKIIAKSANQLISPSVTTVYVDVPVDRTELVIFNKTAQIAEGDSFESSLAYIEEFASFVSTLTTEEEAEELAKEVESIQRGDTIYVGLKYYPTRSAVKYSKMNSTNLIVEYKNEIEKLIEEHLSLENIAEENASKLMEVASHIEALMKMFEFKADKFVTIKEFVEQYKNLMVAIDNSLIAEQVRLMKEEFAKNLKYNTLDEKVVNEIKKIISIEKVEGTNFYKLETSDTDGNVNLYSYTFINSLFEDENKTNLEEGDKSQILPLLEQYSQLDKPKTLKEEATLKVDDVSVDSIIVNGSIENFYTNQKITLIAGKNAENDALTSYLQIVLQNSLSPHVDLQSKLGNVAIRFEEKLPGNTGKSLDGIIEFLNSDKIIDKDGLTFYKPIIDPSNINTSYWEFYSATPIVNDVRIKVKYFCEDGTEIETIALDVFAVTEVSKNAEDSVGWTNTAPVDIKVIELAGIIDVESGDPTKIMNYSQNVSYNFNELIDINDNNFYQSYKVFVYSESADEKISEDFHNILAPKTYTFGIHTLNLYELTTGILQIKNIAQIPTYEIKVVFATIKTDYKGTPILTDDGLYNIIKYSEDKDGNLSAIKVTCSNSLQTINGELSIEDINKAGTINVTKEGVEVKEFQVAHATNNVLKVLLTSADAGFKTALHNGEINVVARSEINSVTNYITVSLEEITDASAVAVISTREVLNITNIKFYITYTIFNQSFLYPIQFATTIGVEANEGAYITNEIASHAKFNFMDAGAVIDLTTVKHLNIDTIFDDGEGLIKKYSITKKDDTTQDLPISAIFTNQIVNVSVINFLKNPDTISKWYLTSSNANVIQISNNGQSFSVGIAGEAVLSLFLENNKVAEEQILIKVSDSGYVSKMIINDMNGQIIQEFSETNVHNPNKNVSVRINGVANDQIYLAANEEDLNIFELYYKIGNDEYKISFDIFVEEESEREILQELANDEQWGGAENKQLILTNSNYLLTLRKNIGSTERVTLAYKNLKLNIVQNVTIDITQTINVKSIDVKYNDDLDGDADDERTLVEFANNTYSIYAKSKFDIDAKLNQGTEVYFFTYDEVNKAYNEITTTSSGVQLLSGEKGFVFDEVGTPITMSIYVSNKQAPTHGDLRYKMVFNVKPNIKLIKNEVNVELTAGTKAVNISEMFERIMFNDSNPFDGISINNKPNFVEYVPADENLVFTYTKVINKEEFKLSFLLRTEMTGQETGIGTVNFVLYPQSLEEENASRIALYNGEKAIVLVAGKDKARFESSQYILTIYNDYDRLSIEKQFNDTANLEVKGDFDEFYDSQGVIVTNSNTSKLLLDTNCILQVKDSAGNIVEYKIIISALDYPYVNYGITDSQKLKNLDLYYLYEKTSDIFNYYTENNLFITMLGGVNDDAGRSLLRLQPSGEVDEKFVFNPQSGKTVEFEITSIDVTDGLKYSDLYEETVTVSGNPVKVMALSVGVVGLDEVFVKVIMTCKQANKSYKIPVIVKVSQSQQLNVQYPYDEECALEDFNNEAMLEELIEFNNMPMEYITSNVSGIANLEIADNRFTVYKPDESNAGNWIVDSTYNSGFEITLDSVAVNIDGEWSFVDSSKIRNYVTLIGKNLTVYKNDASALRIKLRVETLSGGAYNYYVVSVDEKVSLTLYKSNGTSHSIVNGADELQLTTGNSIILRNQSASGFSYYLNNYNENLYYRITDENGNEISNAFTVTTEMKDANIEVVTLTANKFPNGKVAYLSLFTKYGELAKVKITIDAYYSYEQLKNVAFGGKTVNVFSNGYIEIKNKQSGTVLPNSTSYELLEVNAIVNNNGTNEEFDAFTTDATNNIHFEHITEDKEVTFTLKVLIDSTDEFILSIKLLVKNSVGVNESAIPVNLYQINRYLDNLDENLWQNYFVTLDGSGEQITQLTDVKFIVKIEDKFEAECNFETDGTLADDNKIDYGTILLSETRPIIKYQIVTNSGLILAEKSVGTTIYPQYVISIHYPQPNSSAKFECEYVKEKEKINLLLPGFDGILRVDVKQYEKDSTTGIYELSESLNKDAFDDSEGDITQVSRDTKTEVGNIEKYVIKVVNNSLPTGANSVIELGTYLFQVIDEEPYEFVSTIEKRTFNGEEKIWVYRGYGDENIFNYVDVVVTMPTIDALNDKKSDDETKFNKDQKFNIEVLKTIGTGGAENEYEIVREGIYYDSSSASVKLRCAILVENIANIEDLRLYITQGENDSKFSFELTKESGYFKMQTRSTIKYNGQEVDMKYHSVLSDKVSAQMSDAEAEVFVVADINVGTYGAEVTTEIIDGRNESFIDNIEIEFNANENKEGLSLIDKFKIYDELGMKFWYNNVKGGLNLSLAISGNYQVDENNKLIDISSRYRNALVIEYRYNNEGEIYDYLLKAVGAMNAGTIIKLQLDYAVKDTDTENELVNTTHYLYVKVNSDIVVEVRNGKTATPNGENNRFELYNTSSNTRITLADVKTNNPDLNNYYIYAYGKYDTEKNFKNVASSMFKTIEGAQYKSITYVGIEAQSNGNLVLIYNQAPGFADRNVELQFEDEYGFKFTYYIKLIALYRIESEVNNTKTVYEGDSISVFNAGASNSSSATGIGIKVVEYGKSEYYTGEISINEIIQIEVGSGSKQEVFTSDDEFATFITRESNKITFNYLNLSTTDFWAQYGIDGREAISISISLELNREDDPDTTRNESLETYHTIGYFTLNKRYDFSIKDENAFIREGEEFDVAHYVSVYDNKEATYLGEASLSDVEVIKVDGMKVDLSALTFIKDANYDYTYEAVSYKAKIKASNVTVIDIINKMEDYVEYTAETQNEFKKLTDDNKTDLVNNIKHNIKNQILNTYGIIHGSGDEYTLSVYVEARDNASNEITETNEGTIQFKNATAGGIQLTEDTNTGAKYAEIDVSQYIIITGRFSENISALTHSFDICLKKDYQTMLIASTSSKVTIAQKSTNKLENAQLTNQVIKRLSVYVNAETDIALKVTKTDASTEVVKHSLTVGKNTTLLDDSKFIGSNVANVELYTGPYTESNGTENVENIYLNGFNQNNIKLVRGLSSAGIKAEGSYSTNESATLYLDESGMKYNSKFEINYQETSQQVVVSYVGGNETIKGKFNLIHRYTGINTNEAYVGTSKIHYIDKDVIDNNTISYENWTSEWETLTTLEESEEESEVVRTWISGFKLIPGVGNSLALAIDENLTFAENLEYQYDEDTTVQILSFEIEAIKSAGGDEGEEKIILNGNDLEIKDPSIIANIVQYYVTIKVYCNACTEGVDNTVEIGTIYLGFKD